eukprot:1195136-Prorocentrum_minimum.AAC.3
MNKTGDESPGSDETSERVSKGSRKLSREGLHDRNGKARGGNTKRIASIERSVSADETAIEHLDRQIGVVHFITGRVSPFLS